MSPSGDDLTVVCVTFWWSHDWFVSSSGGQLTVVCVIDTFWTNPQFRVSIVDPDEDDEDGNGSIIVGLMQKERRKMRMEGKDNHTIGYAIYEVSDLAYTSLL